MDILYHHVEFGGAQHNASLGDDKFVFLLAPWDEVLLLFTETGADQPDPANYRLISNLSIISKVLERLALAQLQPHLFNSANFCPF